MRLLFNCKRMDCSFNRFFGRGLLLGLGRGDETAFCLFFAFIFHKGIYVLMDFMNFLRNFALCFQNIVIFV